jgi:hypothetical protein
MRGSSSESAARADIRKRTGEQEEHGRQLVTAEKRTWILFARQQEPLHYQPVA